MNWLKDESNISNTKKELSCTNEAWIFNDTSQNYRQQNTAEEGCRINWSKYGNNMSNTKKEFSCLSKAWNVDDSSQKLQITNIISLKIQSTIHYRWKESKDKILDKIIF